MKTKPPYQGSWYDRFGPLVVKNRIISIPAALLRFKKDLGLNNQHMVLWIAISSRYRGTEAPILQIEWLADAIDRTPDYTRKLLTDLKDKGLLHMDSLSGYRSRFDLSPTNHVLDDLLTRGI